MEFDPRNNAIRLCLQGMGMEEAGRDKEASKPFLQAWNESTNDFEKYIAAYNIARHQENVPLCWPTRDRDGFSMTLDASL